MKEMGYTVSRLNNDGTYRIKYHSAGINNDAIPFAGSYKTMDEMNKFRETGKYPEGYVCQFEDCFIFFMPKGKKSFQGFTELRLEIRY